MINVGANKGYAALDFLQAWGGCVPTPSSWAKVYEEYAELVDSGFLRWAACGMCGECRARVQPARSRHASPVVHALELMPETRAALRYAINKTGTEALITVWSLAASNASATVRLPPRRRYIGSEWASLPMTPVPNTAASDEYVDVTTIDAFLRTIDVDAVQHLMIDVEGHDALVLEGARETLQAKRVEVVSFEYSGHGYWNARAADRRTLRETQRWLLELDYHCFLIGRRTLFPISGECWNSSLERRRWSNVACASSPRAVRALGALARAQGA